MTEKIIAQGAEAKIILEKDFIIKDRIKKNYRIPELDKKIRTRRTKSEAKLLLKAAKVTNVPKPLPIKKNSTEIKMPLIKGEKLSENLDKFSLENQKEICRKIGESIAKIHKAEIIHGDLTTSNMILKDGEIFLIDFGLGYVNSKIEHKAVDLHLLKQALEAKHFKNWEILFKEFLEGYKKSSDFEKTIERLKAVEKRGRYKH